MRGFSLLAIGSSAYGEWAYNLARSLRHFTDLPIQLIYEDSAVATIDKKGFDVLTKIKPQHSRPGGKLNPCYAKLRLYDYLPDEWETVQYLDVDALCIKDPSPLFDFKEPFGIQVNGVTNQDSGVYGNMLWMEIGKFREVFNKPTGSIPGVNSSIMIINRSDEAEQVFSDALFHYHNYTSAHDASALHMRWGRKRDAGAILPDELFFNASLTGKEGYSLGQPIKFHHRRLPKWEGLDAYLNQGCYYLGYWGNANYNTPAIQKEYDRLVSVYGGKSQINRLLKGKFVNIN